MFNIIIILNLKIIDNNKEYWYQPQHRLVLIYLKIIEKNLVSNVNLCVSFKKLCPIL